MATEDEEDDYNFVGLYENGHWDWKETTKEIIFISNCTSELNQEVLPFIKAPTGTIEFKDDVDLIEQDVKDVAIYTAPLSILSPQLIDMLHLPTTERFIRALVLCVQYYLQVADEMTHRILALQTQIRTPESENFSRIFSENLSDLRLLVAKEYTTMLFGGSDTRKFHHMGPNKRRRSLSDKDARLIETLLRMCVQIVWLALGRKSFNQIELEINRIFKTEIFNSVEHRLHTGYINKMTKEEREVLLGSCLRHDKKLNTRSPLINEVFCHREIDYRMMGLGVIKYSEYNPRLVYLKNAIAAPEEMLVKQDIVLGIIGLPRSEFDTMLKPLFPTSDEHKSKMSVLSTSKSSRLSTGSTKKSVCRKLYPDIVLPSKRSRMSYPPSFSVDSEKITPSSVVQLRRWQKRLQNMLRSRNN